MARQTKKPIEVRFELYRSNFDLSSNGYLRRNERLFLIYGDNSLGIDANEGKENEKTFVDDVEYEAREIKKRFPNAQIIVFFADRERRLNHFADGYFGRPAIHARTTILKPIGKRRQSRLKSLLSKLNQEGLVTVN